jgi:membrane fusion protein, multidrug efflux system
MIKRFVIAILLLTLLSGGLVGFNLYREKAMEGYYSTMKRPPVPVSAQAVEAISWKPVIEAFGTMSAARGIELSTQTAGLVRSIGFTANDRLAEGQLVVQIDDTVEQADLGAAQAAVTRDQRAMERSKTLSERGVSSAATLQDAEAALAVSTSQLAHLQAIVQQKAVFAPFAGVVGIPRIEVGQFVAAGAAVASLQDLDSMRVDFTVREQDFDLLAIGQPVTAGIEGESITYDGHIAGIDPRVDPASRLVSVRATIDMTAQALHPGGFARIEVALPEEPGILAIPQTALVTSLYGDFVYRVAKPKADAASGSADSTLVAQQVFVTTGRRSGGLVEIVKGLDAGDMIVSAGQNRLSNGAVVTVTAKTDPSAPSASATALPGAVK